MVDGAEIAERFEAANAEATAFILGPARDVWDDETESEGWPVGVVARHIALGHDLMASWARGIKSREPITSGMDIHTVNAEVAARGVVATPDEVAELLRSGATRVSEALRVLTADDLQGEVSFGGQQLPAQMLAEASLRHVHGHLDSIRAVVERVTA